MKRNIALMGIVLLLMVYAFLSNRGAEFEGADAQAETVIEEIRPDYQPWFEPLWEPPSSEIESLLFALQAALGSGFICYYLGYTIGRKKAVEQSR